MEQSLNQKLTSAVELEYLKLIVADIIKNNLNPDFELRPYQVEAFSRFNFWWKSKKRIKPTQLLYHMATGSGKTLIMAGLILYLYEKGYRNFIFFVNSTNIINKTRDNFLNPGSFKYLFSETISFGDKQIKIKEVDNFQAVNEDDINIIFSTIQGLHSKLNTPRENTVTYEDFEDKKIVLISDEAHHINAETKKSKERNKEDVESIVSWEQTVNKIFHSNKNNALLEFTATAEITHPDISKKYYDKLIFDYPLKQFRLDGYSKEVKVLQADLSPLDRALQGVVLSQYRLKIFNKYRLNIKPVILFKSKFIPESENIEKEFTKLIKNLTVKTLKQVLNGKSNDIIKRAMRFFKKEKITLSNLVTELKEAFNEDKYLSVNSKNDSEKKQLIVNSLEDDNNEYRAVFAVDKLNEGWDVLNLFDIVRLYETRDSKSNRPGPTTIKEAQLIGRGARYCPFQLSSDQPKFERKFDREIDHDLRICEELYYHSAHNPRYIQELNTALREIGMKPERDPVRKEMKLKDEFKNTDFWNTGFIFLNKQVKYDRSDITSLGDHIIKAVYKYSIRTGYVKETVIFENNLQLESEKLTKKYALSDFGLTVFRKAINKLEFYKFSNLQYYFPHLESVREFITSDKYLKNISVEVEGTITQVENLTPDLKLEITVSVLDKISKEIPKGNVEFKGTKVFDPVSLRKTFKDKILNIVVNEEGDQEFGKGMGETTNQELYLDLSKKDWYAYNENFGTSEEKYLVRYINNIYESLKKNYDKIYLLRNERFFKIFRFSDGRAVEPDFVLFLQEAKNKKKIIYQLFIEPKGDHLLETDRWKEDFLKEIAKEYEIRVVFENKEFKIIGLPFYNKGLETEFENSIKSKI